MYKVCRKSCDWPSLSYPGSPEEIILDLRIKVNELNGWGMGLRGVFEK